MAFLMVDVRKGRVPSLPRRFRVFETSDEQHYEIFAGLLLYIPFFFCKMCKWGRCISIVSSGLRKLAGEGVDMQPQEPDVRI